MSNIVLATAGHIDHGKTALLKALTGIDADRLPEERRRGMTVDVGYAFLTLTDGSEIDFVDVPGHEDLLNNMIVGAAEADGFLLVVDATEGIRPQTIEHLDVLQALALRHGVAAITKADRADRSETRDAAIQARATLRKRFNGPVEVIVVSSRTGQGLRELTGALSNLRRQILGDRSASANRMLGPPVLPIDRVFAVKGRGVVMTGTLRGGRLAEGQVVSVEPVATASRVVELQRHGQRLGEVCGSGRVAVRLRGVRRDGLARGMVLTGPYVVWRATQALVSLSAEASQLRPGTELMVHSATDRVEAVIARTWEGGSARLARLRLGHLMALTPGSTLLLRRASIPAKPERARLVDAGDGGAWRRISADQATRLAVAQGARDQIKAFLDLRGGVGDQELRTLVELSGEADGGLLEQLATAAGPLWLTPGLHAGLEELLSVYASGSGGAGFSAAQGRQALVRHLAAKARCAPADASAAAQAILDNWVTTRRLVRHGAWLFDASSYGLANSNDATIRRLLTILSAPNPPALSAAILGAGCSAEKALELERQGAIVRISDQIAYAAATYVGLVDTARTAAARQPLTPAMMRDAIHATRKYAVALLEHLDAKGVLVRTPDGHVLPKMGAFLSVRSDADGQTEASVLPLQTNHM
jgi:selenocysteine-specific elongation factor